MYSTYILETSDNRYYIGSTKDISQRLVRHQRGECKFTSSRLPVKLVYQENYSTRSSALKREKQLKRWRSRDALEKLFKN